MRCCGGLVGHVELAQRRDLCGSPVVVGHWEEQVIAASDETVQFGVVPGMPMRQAEHLCPQAAFLSPDPIAAGCLRELIASALYDVAPGVEVSGEGVASLGVGGVLSPCAPTPEARRRRRAAGGAE